MEVLGLIVCFLMHKWVGFATDFMAFAINRLRPANF